MLDSKYIVPRRIKRVQVTDCGSASELIPLVRHRESMFGIFRRNDVLQKSISISPADALASEVKAIVSTCQALRGSGNHQATITKATYLSKLSDICAEAGLKVDAAATLELATALWDQNEPELSVKMLQKLVLEQDLEKQSIPVGLSGILAQLVSHDRHCYIYHG